MRKMKNPWIHKEGYNCFGCCPDNAAGVKMEFYTDGDEVVSYWRPQPQFQGWIDTLHGGVQAVLLDEISSWVVFGTMQTSGVTTKMETRYKRPLSTNAPYIELRAKVTEVRRNIVTIEAVIRDHEGKICTEAVCVYFTFPGEKAREMGFSRVELDAEDVDKATILSRLGVGEEM